MGGDAWATRYVPDLGVRIPVVVEPVSHDLACQRDFQARAPALLRLSAEGWGATNIFPRSPRVWLSLSFHPTAPRGAVRFSFQRACPVTGCGSDGFTTRRLHMPHIFPLLPPNSTEGSGPIVYLRGLTNARLTPARCIWSPPPTKQHRGHRVDLLLHRACGRVPTGCLIGHRSRIGLAEQGQQCRRRRRPSPRAAAAARPGRAWRLCF